MAEQGAAGRQPLTRARVLAAAVDLADRDGIDAITMRSVGGELGVEAMSLYNHVRNKEDLLDGMVAAVVDGIELVGEVTDWQADLRAQALRARAQMRSHPWAPPVIVDRTEMTPPLLAYFDVVVGILLEGGFSPDLAHHATHALGSRILGFTQELFADDTDMPLEEFEVLRREFEPVFPNLARMMTAVAHGDTLIGCDDDVEFAFGLDLLLDSLERRREAASW